MSNLLKGPGKKKLAQWGRQVKSAKGQPSLYDHHIDAEQEEVPGLSGQRKTRAIVDGGKTRLRSGAVMQRCS
jgi:hypothetical protein